MNRHAFSAVLPHGITTIPYVFSELRVAFEPVIHCVTFEGPENWRSVSVLLLPSSIGLVSMSMQDLVCVCLYDRHCEIQGLLQTWKLCCLVWWQNLKGCTALYVACMLTTSFSFRCCVKHCVCRNSGPLWREPRDIDGSPCKTWSKYTRL